MEEQFGVFNAVSSLSLVDGGDLSQRMESAEPQMSALELHHFVPKSKTNFSNMFHRPFETAIYTKNQELQAHCGERFGITKL